MLNLQLLRTKVNALKAMVQQFSISPVYLGSILDSFIEQIEQIDPSSMADSVQIALNDAAEALETAKAAVEASENAETVALSAAKNVLLAVEKVDDAIQIVNEANFTALTAKSTADAAASTAIEAKQIAEFAAGNASSALTNSATAVSTANEANTNSSEALAAIDEIMASVGQPEGLIQLDASGMVPDEHLPKQKKQVVYFDNSEYLSNTELVELPSTLSSDSPGCKVIYDVNSKAFVLKSISFNSGVELQSEEDEAPSVSLQSLLPGELIVETVHYWRLWADASDFGVIVGEGVLAAVKPEAGRIYINKETNEVFCGSGASLKALATRMVSIEYDSLVALRESSKLIPGVWYRITDYVTTVANDPEARSMAHPFDIAVLATGPATLSEEARAIRSARDTAGYFAQAKIDAWKVWYCLDNDITRFQWADSENGKGVIYRLIDEWQNDCPYDFKSIQFKRYAIDYDFWEDELGSEFYCRIVMAPTMCDVNLGDWFLDEDGPSGWFYTFSLIVNWGYGGYEDEVESIEVEDASNRSCFDDYWVLYNGDKDMCVGNIMAPYRNTLCLDSCYYRPRALNNIVLFTSEQEDQASYGMSNNVWGPNCYEMTLAEHCWKNKFGCDCHTILMLHSAENSFGNDCNTICTGYYCSENSFGNRCEYVLMKKACSSNYFGIGCLYINISQYCDYNILGDYCVESSFGDYCESNRIGHRCTNISFYDKCARNVIEIDSDEIIFETGCTDNVLGPGTFKNRLMTRCIGNVLGPTANNNTIGSDTSNCYFHPGVQRLIMPSNIWNAVVLAPGSPSQSTTITKITSSQYGNGYYTKFIGVNSSGELKIWNPADLVEE